MNILTFVYSILLCLVICAKNDYDEKCSALPTHSRLQRNIVEWHKNYDDQYMVTEESSLSSKQINEYYQNGYIVLKNIIPTNMINDCLADIEILIDKVANKLYNSSLINNLCSNYTVFNRLICIENQYKGSNILSHKLGELYQSYINIFEYKPLTDIAIQLLQPPINNPSIAAHPSWNLRAKLPFNEESNVPWHQDAAYFDTNSRNVHQLTVWIPFLNVSNIHGPMQLIRKGHIPGNIATHTCCYGHTRFISLSEKIIEDEIIEYINESDKSLKNFIETITLNKGDILLFSNVIPHRSVENLSDIIRWSLDIRYHINGISNGFDHIKPSLKVRDLNDNLFIPEWKEWKRINRVKLQFGNKDTYNELEIYTGGPWMDYWEIVNQNNHTDAYFNKTGTK